MSDKRQHVHALIDQLPPVQLAAVETILQSMLDPLARALANAEIDDEPVTDDDRQSIEASREWFKHNKGSSIEEVAAELGFTMEEVTNYKDPSC
ncbi:MAG: hypothetical protein ABI811_07625 [Acidobacteriota bacterium]